MLCITKQSDYRETSKMTGISSKRRTQGVVLLVGLVAVLVVSGVDLWLGSHACDSTFCPNYDIIDINSVTLSSNGWATFNMTGAQAYNHTIKTVTAVKEPYPGYQPAPTPLGTVYLSSNNFLPAKRILILSVQFQGVTWQPAVNYTFGITTYEGPWLEVQGCLSGCNR